jgi:hypothetical protein
MGFACVHNEYCFGYAAKIRRTNRIEIPLPDLCLVFISPYRSLPWVFYNASFCF